MHADNVRADSQKRHELEFLFHLVSISKRVQHLSKRWDFQFGVQFLDCSDRTIKPVAVSGFNGATNPVLLLKRQKHLVLGNNRGKDVVNAVPCKCVRRLHDLIANSSKLLCRYSVPVMLCEASNRLILLL